jgi:amidohydrolase
MCHIYRAEAQRPVSATDRRRPSGARITISSRSGVDSARPDALLSGNLFTRPEPRMTRIRSAAATETPCTIARVAASLVRIAAGLAVAATPLVAQRATAMHSVIDAYATRIESEVIAWRRDIHQHPELSFQETRTAKLVAEHLRALGLEVQTGVGGNGVVGILRGGKPGPVVALRADMDALPVTEVNDLPFKSLSRGTYRGQAVGIMHACGHDTHTAMLMGAASVLTSMKAELPGTVKFLFQPAEEGPPVGGAGPMIEAGVLENPHVDAIFGLHVGPGPLGSLVYRAGPVQASADNLEILIKGRQTHGAMPWGGVDPIVVGSQVVMGLQTIVSRQTDIGVSPTVITIGSFHGGVRGNIVPDSVTMVGTIRTFTEAERIAIHARIKRTAENIAEAAGATATVMIERGYPVTVNSAPLVGRMLPTLERVAGRDNVMEAPLIMASEDFARFQEKVPGFFISLGVTSPDADWHTVAGNHSPLFMVDERALRTGVRALASLTIDYMLGANSGAGRASGH